MAQGVNAEDIQGRSQKGDLANGLLAQKEAVINIFGNLLGMVYMTFLIAILMPFLIVLSVLELASSEWQGKDDRR